MLSIRPLLKTIPPMRKMSAIGGPPSVRVTKVETFCHGFVIIATCMAFPAYVLTHIRQYRGLE